MILVMCVPRPIHPVNNDRIPLAHRYQFFVFLLLAKNALCDQ